MKEEAFQSSISLQCKLHITRILYFLNIILLYSLKMQLKPKLLFNLNCLFKFFFSPAHSPTFPSLYLRHSSFSNLSVTLPTSQLILQPFRRFAYVIARSPTLPLLHLRHSSFINPSFASPTSQALYLRHLANRPCLRQHFKLKYTNI